MLQSVALLAAAAALTLWPPERGAMLLIPLDGRTAAAIDAVRGADARLLGRGPIAGSIVVFGDRARLLAGRSAAHLLATAAPASGCGAFRTEAA